MKNKILFLFLLISSFCCAQSQEQNLRKNEEKIRSAGDVVQYALPFAAGLSTIILWDKAGVWQFAKSFGTAVVLTYGLKIAIDKPRPNGAIDGRAFPSGHTTLCVFLPNNKTYDVQIFFKCFIPYVTNGAFSATNR